MGKRENLKSDVKHELQNLEKLMDELKSTCIGHDIGSRRVIGSILHDSYNCCERIFRLIVGKINGAIPFCFEWHRQLLNKVTHEVEGLQSSCYFRTNGI